MYKLYFLLLCLGSSSGLLAQVEYHTLDDISSVPKVFKDFTKKLETQFVSVENIEQPLQRIQRLTPGVYTNSIQLDKFDSQLMRHIYTVVPILQNADTQHQWFYEQSLIEFNMKEPVYQNVFYYEETPQGIIRINYHLPNNPKAYANFWDDEEAGKLMAALRPEDLRRIPACEMKVKELEKGHFMTYTVGRDCHDGYIRDVAYSAYEFHYFEHGASVRPIGFSAEDKVLWGVADEHYLFERQKLME